MTKVSLLYAKSGGGHLSLATATAQALDKYYPGKFTYTFFDPFPAITATAYKRLSIQMQQLWKFSYEATNTPQFSSFIHDITNLTLTDKLVAHFKKYRPDIIVTNNPLITTEMQSALTKSGITAKTVVIFADPFTAHETWFNYKTADLYLSPTPEVTRLAIDHYLPASKIQTTGWLTRDQFIPGPCDKTTARTHLGLNPGLFTVFVGGGGQGGGKVYAVCEAILSHPYLLSHSQLIVNTGINSQLVTKIMKLAQIIPSFFYIIPLAHNMHTLLSASDLVVGKAGPNFLFESVHTLRPLLATGCLPGQEEGNLDFIRKAKIGWVEENPDKAAALIDKIARRPDSLAAFTPRLREVKSQNIDSARHIADAVAGLVL